MVALVTTYIMAMSALLTIPFTCVRLERIESKKFIFTRIRIPNWIQRWGYFEPSSRKLRLVITIAMVDFGYLMATILHVFFIRALISASPLHLLQSAWVAMACMVVSCFVFLFDMAFTWTQEIIHDRKMGDEL